MSMMGEIGGVSMAYVARKITEGEIKKTVARFDEKLNENVHEVVSVDEPVIVFFPNGTSQVFSTKRAEEEGFLRQPEILNLSQVEGSNTPAGRYKNAIRDRDRHAAWEMMEDSLITNCISKSGHPIPLDCQYSDKSMYLEYAKEEEEVK